MADFLLELLSEEIPARMQAAAIQQLQERFLALLQEAGLAAQAVNGFVTPRRLALHARGIPDESADVQEERRGPREGAPEKAIEGFLRGIGLPRDALALRETPKGRFYYAVLSHKGESAKAILEARLPRMLESMSWPKSQRWGAASLSTASPRWVRPLRRIVALFGREVLSFEALGVAAGRLSAGHRFMAAGPLSIPDPESYAQALQGAHVLLDPAQRQERIHAGSMALAREAGLTLVEDVRLEAENAGLAEWPIPLLGRFAPEYLAVPREIIELTMRTHQKYFSLNDAQGQLAPAFICIANIEAEDGGNTIVRGNERVLSARFADARFFWEQDCKVPLAERAKRLSGIVFHEKLGTMADKVARVRRLAGWLQQEYFPDLPLASVERAAALAKADLVTGTVGEFPEIQGVAGGYLAEVQGEAPEVVAALRAHYETAPKGKVAQLVALADRIDTLVSFFGVDIRPTGSRDPFALRRAAISIIEIIVSNGLRLPLKRVFEEAGSRDTGPLLAFFADRLKAQQKEAGVRHDLVDAVFALDDEDDLVRLLARVQALQNFLEGQDGQNLMAGYRRAANILRIEEKKEGVSFSQAPDRQQLQEEAETALYKALAESGKMAEVAIRQEDFEGAMAAFAILRAPVDRFFEEVTVNADERALRFNRLSLLAKLRDTANLVADFARVEG